MTDLCLGPSSGTKSLISAVTIVIALFGSVTPAHAQDSAEESGVGETVVTLRQGQPAPFAGTLFSVAAAARLLANLELSRETCDLEITRRVRLAEANMQLQIDTERARYTALELRHNELMTVRDEQIEFLLERNRQPEWFQTNEFWFAMGAVGAVLVVIAGGVVLGLAN